MATGVPKDVTTDMSSEVTSDLSAQPSHAAGVAKLFAAPAVQSEHSATHPDTANTTPAFVVGSGSEDGGHDHSFFGDGAAEDADARAEDAGAEDAGAQDAEDAGARAQNSDAEDAGVRDQGVNADEFAVAARTPSEASTTSKRGRVAEESDNMQQHLESLEATPNCTKCFYPIEDIMRAKLYGKQSGVPTFICRPCNNVITLVNKHMDLKQLNYHGLSFGNLSETTEGQEFFKQAKAAAALHGRQAWPQVREMLTAALVERRMKVVKIRYTDKELPLSVWETQGYDREEILQYGKQVDHPVFSNVYKAPLRETERTDLMHP
jgi:hypothetical protein